MFLDQISVSCQMCFVQDFTTETLQEFAHMKDINERTVLLKLYSGEMIMGKKISTNEDTMMSFTETLHDPREVMIAPTVTGSVRVVLGSVCEPFNVKRLKESVAIQKSQILFELSEDEIESELLAGYKSEISGIKLASPADVSAVGTSSVGSNRFMQ